MLQMTMLLCVTEVPGKDVSITCQHAHKVLDINGGNEDVDNIGPNDSVSNTGGKTNVSHVSSRSSRSSNASARIQAEVERAAIQAMEAESGAGVAKSCNAITTSAVKATIYPTQNYSYNVKQNRNKA